MKSACPRCRAYSSIMWIMIQRSEYSLPFCVPVQSSDGAASTRAFAGLQRRYLPVHRHGRESVS
jgi:hypothetical protein